MNQRDELDALRYQHKQLLDHARNMARALDAVYVDSVDAKGRPLYAIKALSVSFSRFLDDMGIPQKYRRGKSDRGLFCKQAAHQNSQERTDGLGGKMTNQTIKKLTLEQLKQEDVSELIKFTTRLMSFVAGNLPTLQDKKIDSIVDKWADDIYAMVTTWSQEIESL